jgi:excisionase family DNA binding protein
MSEFMDRKQVAQLFGVSLPTILRWQRAGKLKPVRLGGGTVRYQKSDLQAFIDLAKL